MIIKVKRKVGSAEQNGDSSCHRDCQVVPQYGAGNRLQYLYISQQNWKRLKVEDMHNYLEEGRQGVLLQQLENNVTTTETHSWELQELQSKQSQQEPYRANKRIKLTVCSQNKQRKDQQDCQPIEEDTAFVYQYYAVAGNWPEQREFESHSFSEPGLDIMIAEIVEEEETAEKLVYDSEDSDTDSLKGNMEDADSNAESYFANDYPEEEEDGDSMENFPLSCNPPDDMSDSE